MAGGSLFTLLDDIASILDDVAVMTKKAASKTAGVLGDDLALNAEQVSGVVAKRELPIVWAVAKGSAVNKLILVPAALLLNAVAPFLVKPLLMIGGAYLCYEGVEKLIHYFAHRGEKKSAEEAEAELKQLAEGSAEIDEAAKIKGAIRTDFVLSAEIIVITLGVVAGKPFLTELMVLSTIALLMTVGVYGLVACIVKLDDAGLYLSRKSGASRTLGLGILKMAPWLMKGLSVVGTAAMFLVGGEILAHGVGVVHHAIEHAAAAAGGVPVAGVVLKAIVPLLLNAVVGILAGIAVVILMTGLAKLRGAKSAA